MPITSFEIVSVPVSDAQRAKHFYRDVLGFDVVRESPMGPNRHWIQLTPPGWSAFGPRSASFPPRNTLPVL